MRSRGSVVWKKEPEDPRPLKPSKISGTLVEKDPKITRFQGGKSKRGYQPFADAVHAELPSPPVAHAQGKITKPAIRDRSLTGRCRNLWQRP
ncbi:predicted protein [Uncinocarpus reesii 1704]|uniref:Uncharacterized protein n=1 Tax=Uncinocarpus reesii (strain UAMH 1704) TaxID=336963 RepID=C4JI33_UNCRE|nr:uncharacterized protein UREG_01458 [Uncinocarpus reesii 1704]EEP76609.1 predicted protein [Uncinocarpus reesii 1704]